MTILYIVLLLAFQLFFLFNLQFTAWPEMLSYPYLRNHGFLIYKDMIHPYPPLLTMSLSWVYQIFGYNLWVMQTVSWGLSLASSAVVFLTTKQITKKESIALLTLFFYVMLQPFLDGNMLWFDNVIVFPILLGLYFALRQNFLFAGLFLSVAMFTKQTTGLFLVFLIIYLVVKKTPWSLFKNLLIGPLVLGVPLLIRLIQEGALVDFLNWTIVFPLTQFTNFPGYVHTELTTGQTLTSVFLLSPLVLLVWNKKLLTAKTFQIVLGFLFVSILIIYPRFSFFHAQAALAILVVCYGYVVKDWRGRNLVFMSIAAVLIISIYVQRPVIEREWRKVARFYGNDDLNLAQTIMGKADGKKTFLLGLHSGLYPMADIVPPKRWTDNFGWYLEIPGIQDEVLDRWDNSPPDLVIWRTPSNGNWFDLGTYQPQKIVKWIKENYNKKEEIKPGVWLWVKN